jgi:hypothetical protein
MLGSRVPRSAGFFAWSLPRPGSFAVSFRRAGSGIGRRPAALESLGARSGSLFSRRLPPPRLLRLGQLQCMSPLRCADRHLSADYRQWVHAL